MITSIGWGILIAILLVTLLFFVPRLLNNRYNHTAGSGILLLAGFFFFTFQGTLLVGSLKAKRYIPLIEKTITAFDFSSSAKEIVGTSSSTEIQEFYKKLSDQHPLLEKYIDQTKQYITEQEIRISKPLDFVHIFLTQLQEQLNRYTYRRIGWITGGILLLVLFLVNSANKQDKQFQIRRHRELLNGQF